MQTLGARILDTVMPWARKNEADSGGELVDTRGRVLPLRSTHLRVAAGQGIARVVLEQRFVNPHDEILDVTYRMPLPPEGAVSGYAFTFADEKVEGVVRPRAEAREAFERAIVEGRTAGLLDQQRPNIFTQRLGNIPKRTELTATITIDMPLTWLPEGAWELRFPTVIGPRYTSAGPNADTIAKEVGIQVSTSALVNRAHVEIHLRDSLVSGALPESPSHTLAPFDARESVVRFVNEEGERLDRDLVVRWRVATPEVGLTLATARPEARTPHGHDAYGIVTLTPPRKKASETHVARDLVILVDTSGSMSGFPLTSAKLAATLLLESLGEADRFELVAFSDAPRPFAASPRSATKSAKREALAWLSALRAGGATEMHTAVIEAMRSLRPGSQRQVVIMTDGYIGGEEEIVRTLVETLPRSCRLHFVCAGSAANRSLALAMARAGRGTECTIAVGEDPERALARLMKGTAGPVLTDVTLSGSAVLESATEYLPDVFADSPLRIAAKLRAEGGELVVKGTSAEGTWEKRVTVPKTGHGEGDRGIVALFARECVEDLEMRMSYGHSTGRQDSAIERLGVVFQIATRLTSWVAISAKITVNPGEKKRSEDVPQEVPHGTTVTSFGLRGVASETDADADDDEALASLASFDLGTLDDMSDAPTIVPQGRAAPSSASFGAAPPRAAMPTSLAGPSQGSSEATRTRAGAGPVSSPSAAPVSSPSYALPARAQAEMAGAPIRKSRRTWPIALLVLFLMILVAALVVYWMRG